MSVKNVILIGPMGVGKTTVGKALARILGIAFVDCDQEMERRTGVSIPTIFDIEGEDGFRKREIEILSDVSSGRDMVIATGGGVIMREENRRVLKESGVVVYLTASVNKLVRRTKNSKTRPLLQQGDPEQRIEQLMSEREPFYQEVADLVIEVDDRSPQFIAHRLKEAIDAHANS